MDEMKMDRTIRETMKQCAEGLEAPDKLKTRIDFALKSGAPAELRRRPKWGKRLAAVCLVAAVAVTGAVAGSGVVSWGSSTRLDKNWTDFEKTAAYVQENIAGAKYVESFSNGFVFERVTRARPINGTKTTILWVHLPVFSSIMSRMA